MTVGARATSALLAALATIGGCGRRPTAAECDALLDRYVELLVREQSPDAPASEIERQKQLTRARAAGNPSFQRCVQEVRASDITCALGAPNVDEFEKCLE